MLFAHCLPPAPHAVTLYQKALVTITAAFLKFFASLITLEFFNSKNSRNSKNSSSDKKSKKGKNSLEIITFFAPFDYLFCT
jgi:hypothetical protein